VWWPADGPCVVHREPYLLVDGQTKSAAELNVHHVIAHELVHQWFGNLVTPSWWSHAWLSEGFAQFFQYVLVDQVRTTKH
jgi:aminopeptidase N